MAFQGNNQSTGIPDLFNFVSNRKLTGMLVIASREHDRSFFFKGGELIYALGSGAGQLLGDVLVRDLNIDQGVIERIAAGRSTKFLGQELVQRGVITQDDLNSVVDRHIRANLREVLRWDEWAFHFEALDLGKGTPDFHLSTQLLVFDLTRELDEWHSIGTILGDLDRIAHRASGSVHQKTPLTWQEDFPPLAEILPDVDGVRSLRKLLRESARPVRNHALALAALAKADIIKLKDPEEAVVKVPDRHHFMMPVVPNLLAKLFAADATGAKKPEDYFDLITSDPVLTSRMLRLMSIQRMKSDRTFSLADSITSIGYHGLKSILLAEATRGLFLFPSSFTWHHYWEQAYTCSIACRHIGELVGYPHLDLAQTAGLLHDIGCIVLAAENPSSYQRVYDYVRSSGVSLVRAEDQVFHTDHTQVGAQVGASWGFPEPIIEVIRHHHDPVRAHQEDILLNIVRLADYLMTPRGTTSKIPRSHLRRLTMQLGLSEPEFEQVKEKICSSSYNLQTTGVLGNEPFE